MSSHELIRGRDSAAFQVAFGFGVAESTHVTLVVSRVLVPAVLNPRGLVVILIFHKTLRGGPVGLLLNPSGLNCAGLLFIIGELLCRAKSGPHNRSGAIPRRSALHLNFTSVPQVVASTRVAAASKVHVAKRCCVANERPGLLIIANIKHLLEPHLLGSDVVRRVGCAGLKVDPMSLLVTPSS